MFIVLELGVWQWIPLREGNVALVTDYEPYTKQRSLLLLLFGVMKGSSTDRQRDWGLHLVLPQEAPPPHRSLRSDLQAVTAWLSSGYQGRNSPSAINNFKSSLQIELSSNITLTSQIIIKGNQSPCEGLARTFTLYTTWIGPPVANFMTRAPAQPWWKVVSKIHASLFYQGWL